MRPWTMPLASQLALVGTYCPLRGGGDMGYDMGPVALKSGLVALITFFLFFFFSYIQQQGAGASPSAPLVVRNAGSVLLPSWPEIIREPFFDSDCGVLPTHSVFSHRPSGRARSNWNKQRGCTNYHSVLRKLRRSRHSLTVKGGKEEEKKATREDYS